MLDSPKKLCRVHLGKAEPEEVEDPEEGGGDLIQQRRLPVTSPNSLGQSIITR